MLLVPKTSVICNFTTEAIVKAMKAEQIVNILLEAGPDEVPPKDYLKKVPPPPRCPMCDSFNVKVVRRPEDGSIDYAECLDCGEVGLSFFSDEEGGIPPKAMMMAVTGGSDFPIAGGGQG